MNSSGFALRFKNKAKIIGKEGVFNGELVNAIDKSELPEFKIHKNSNLSRGSPTDINVQRSCNLPRLPMSTGRSSSTKKVESCSRIRFNRSPLLNNAENILRSVSPTLLRKVTILSSSNEKESNHHDSKFLRIGTGLSYQVIKKMMSKRFKLKN
jgi:hypothetical protein